VENFFSLENDLFVVSDVKPEVYLWGNLQIDGLSSFPKEINLKISNIWIHPSLAKDSYRACVDTISANLVVSQTKDSYSYDTPVFSADPTDALCVENNSSLDYSPSGYKSVDVNWNITLETGTSWDTAFYNYPYDSIFITGKFTCNGRKFDNTGNVIGTFSIPCHHELTINLSGWETSIEKSYPTSDRSTTYPHGIILRRSKLLRIITPFLLCIFFGLTIAVLFFDTISTTVEVIIALVIGILGVRQILIPNETPGITALETLFLGEYGAIALVLIAQIVMNYVTSKGNNKDDKKVITKKRLKNK